MAALAVFAAFEREVLQERTRAGFAHTRQKAISDLLTRREAISDFSRVDAAVARPWRFGERLDVKRPNPKIGPTPSAPQLEPVRPVAPESDPGAGQVELGPGESITNPAERRVVILSNKFAPAFRLLAGSRVILMAEMLPLPQPPLPKPFAAPGASKVLPAKRTQHPVENKRPPRKIGPENPGIPDIDTTSSDWVSLTRTNLV